MRGQKVVLAAGGTGGHMFPAQALAVELGNRDWQAALITDERGLALAKDFPADPIETVAAATVSPRNPIRAVIGSMRIAGGVGQARKLMAALKPDVVVGFGGYPAFPALAAAGKTPIVLHEQNAVLGRVNRVFANRAAVVASGFKRLEKLPSAAANTWRITGNPVRDPILSARDMPFSPPTPDGEVQIFIMGGSLGARILSETAPRAIARLPEELRRRLVVTQQTREDHLEWARTTYAQAQVRAECQPFFKDVASLFAQAHLVIGRAGASTVTEIAVVGRPSILVPLRIAMDDHQTLNARSLEEAGGADVVLEKEFDTQKLATLIEQRLSNPQDLARRAAAARAVGRPDATTALADIVEHIAAMGRAPGARK